MTPSNDFKMDYKKLLQKARKELPESVLVKERFEIPKVRGHIQGNKTVLSNFFQIADTLTRKPEHMLKFLTKELATPITKKGNMVVLGSKVSASMINDRTEPSTRLFGSSQTDIVNVLSVPLSIVFGDICMFIYVSVISKLLITIEEPSLSFTPCIASVQSAVLDKPGYTFTVLTIVSNSSFVPLSAILNEKTSSASASVSVKYEITVPGI